MLTLHNKDFTTKYGAINSVIEAFVEEERNGLFELSFIMLNTDSLFQYVKEDNIVVANANNTLLNQKFRIYMTRKLMNNRVEVFARHISFDLMYDYIDNISFENQSCEYALNSLFRGSQFSKHYKGYSDIINAQNYNMSMANILEAIGGKEGSILDTFGNGAELLRDNENIYVLNKRGRDNSVTIEYKKNLTGFELEEDTTDLVTRILPYAKGENDEIVKASFVDSPLMANYSHPFVKAIDYTDKFEEGEEVTTSKLIAFAQNEYKVNKVDMPKQNFKIEFIPLSKCLGYEPFKDNISLCDTVTIKDTRYNIDTQAKVIKTTFNVLKNRYEAIELGEPRTSLGDIIGNNDSTKGEKGDKGDKGDKGEDGSIGDFPDSLPATPIVATKVYGFANIEISWTFENKVYYQYEVYASKEANFTPNTFNLIHSGQTSTYMYQAKPNETWYFKVCAINTHEKRTNFGYAYATTTKVDDLSNYVGEMAIDNALIGTLNLDRGWVGTLKGNYIDAKQLSVTNGNGERTLDIDSYGNVNLNVASLKISSSSVATESTVNNTINNAVNNIQVGGRNLFKGYSKDEEIVLPVYNTVGGFIQIRDKLAFNPADCTGETFTVSFYAKSPNGQSTLSIYNSNGNPRYFRFSKMFNEQLLNTNWQYYVYTFTSEYNPNGDISSSNKIEFYVPNKTGVIIKNIKLERGNKPTDWTPALEDTESQITSLTDRIVTAETKVTDSAIINTVSSTITKTVTENINNIQIGSANLLKGFTRDTEYTLPTFQNKGSFVQYTDNLTINPANYVGDSFTISFYAKSPNGTTPLSLYNNNGNPRYFYFNTTLDSALGSSWKYYSYTFVNNDRGSSYSVSNKIEIYAPNQMGVVIKNLKVERGNKATDWTPAPEDISSEIEAKIYTAKSEIIQTTDSIASTVSKHQDDLNWLADEKSRIEQKADSIQSTVTSIQGDYVGQSQFTQTVENFEFKFNSTNSPNLIPNGNPKKTNYLGWSKQNNANFWLSHPNDLLGIYNTTSNVGYAFSPYAKLTEKGEYSVSFFVQKEVNVKNCKVYLIGSIGDPNVVDWAVDCTGEIYNNNFNRINLNVNIPSNINYVRFRVDHNGTASASGGYVVWFGEFMLIKGHNIFPKNWYPAVNEVHNHTTSIDSSGLTVTHNDGSYSKMSGNGFEFFSSGSSNRYHNLIVMGEYECYSEETRTITLPNEFKGKPFKVITSVKRIKANYDLYSYKFPLLSFYAQALNVNTTNGTFQVYASIRAWNQPKVNYNSWGELVGDSNVEQDQIKPIVAYWVIA